MRNASVLLLFLLLAGIVCAQGQVTIYLAGDSTMAQKLPEKRPRLAGVKPCKNIFAKTKCE